ncbi:hypothetical protein ACQR1E_21200 [Bradyrhizobium sp. HKCCYLRH1030]|uniref:hypothetical protein n=1 Tax=Bradyrhizobium sp. SZCCHNS30571 TaxID=3057324 RepID=UPI003966C7E3
MFGRMGVDAKVGGAAIPGWTVTALVFIPFAAGYFLSYLFRTINGVVSPRLASELGPMLMIALGARRGEASHASGGRINRAEPDKCSAAVGGSGTSR